MEPSTRDKHGAFPRSARSTLISLIPRIGSGNETYLTVQFQCKHMGVSADTARSPKINDYVW